MRMKKWIAVLLGLVLILNLTACAEKLPGQGMQAALCFRKCDDTLTQPYRDALEEALSGDGYTVCVADAQNDQAEQNRQIDEFIAQKYDILIVDPVMVAEAQTIVDKAKAADIPVLFVGHEPEAAVLESWNKACFIGCDVTKPGMLQGQIVLTLSNQADVNGDGMVSYLMLRGPEAHMDAQLRTDGCVQTLTNAGVTMNRLETVVGDWTEETGERLCKAALSKYGKDIEVIFCNNGAMAVGAASAIQDGGWIQGRDIYLVGISEDREDLALIQQDKMTGTVLDDIQGQVDQVLETIPLLIKNKPVQDQYYIEYIAITRGNVADYMEA